MSRTTYYTATSLDGFIADEHHSLDWLVTQDIDPKGPMSHDEFMGRVGALVMGSSTYQWLLDNHIAKGGSWDYKQPSWVMTSRERELARVEGADIRFASGDVRPVHAAAAAVAGDLDIWVVGGGDLAGQFVDAGLLDDVIVSFAPVTLGTGAPLLPRKLDLRLVELAQNRAFACARYDVVGPRTPSS
ncbi:dihydrofolate reductase family protein [Frankia sp. CNm7]|uniref:Dihydrofolate reductase family protein n=1 Tax=Frankia nepalensis TaxID=1836974 RepID=A0A937RN16_9ACTN|nr:dihydrofolate reductase family protein [Frankia nepalensis]MBL7500610.1 dihydrofolate reductase family protein [Frankia nepalensis]MBL7510989.1 dihydrofolate reductase family protein [Frankia nepalensis]MBL7518488.1 dihydrofolate reductase family protein [Frankia nepalensis]MBL7630294.1 dihydrofolate reductase family protein [Frankia nepalensis]